MTITNDHGLLVSGDTCLGYLLIDREHGVYDASLGRIDVTADDANRHNTLYDKAIIKGLDQCPVGMGGVFYLSGENGENIATWMGTVVGRARIVRQPTTRRSGICEFERNGMTFTGKVTTKEDCIFFTRIA